MSHVTYFNRHEHMPPATLKKIGVLIDKAMENGCGMMGVTNMLYGLYDGYLYADLLTDAKKELPEDVYAELEEVVKEIEGYPKTETDTTIH